MSAVSNHLSNIWNIVSNQKYIQGGIKGALPHLAKMAPKQLFHWTKNPLFNLLDISIRLYRNIPERNISWLKWGVKSTLLAASAIRLFQFFQVIPKETAFPIELFLIFSSLVSGLKSLSKGIPLLERVRIVQEQEAGESAVSGLFYCAFSAAKISAFSVYMMTLLTFSTYNEYILNTDVACYNTHQLGYTPRFEGLFDITY